MESPHVRVWLMEEAESKKLLTAEAVCGLRPSHPMSKSEEGEFEIAQSTLLCSHNYPTRDTTQNRPILATSHKQAKPKIPSSSHKPASKLPRSAVSAMVSSQGTESKTENPKNPSPGAPQLNGRTQKAAKASVHSNPYGA